MRAKELAVAEVLHQFLECSQGQLTAHGLVSLQEVRTLVCPCELACRLAAVVGGMPGASCYLGGACSTLNPQPYTLKGPLLLLHAVSG